ncbi:MAG: flavodoxin family protein [Vulcanimicrobiota bacterium]
MKEVVAMKVLGLVGSARKLGNTEILVKECISPFLEQSHDLSLIRLSDLNVKPCIGCMKCVFRSEKCPIEDDMAFLVDAVRECDILIAGAPTYLLGPSGIIKTVTDRFFSTIGNERSQFVKKKAATIAVAGVRGWDSFALPQLNILPLSLGFRLIGSILIHAPGPGEVLLDSEAVKKAHLLGEMLLRNDHDEVPSLQADSPYCPVCRGSIFKITAMDRLECPCCNLKGTLKEDADGRPFFLPVNADRHRWTDEAMKAHVEGWIKGTEGSFKERMKSIFELRKPYRKMEHLWLSKGT